MRAEIDGLQSNLPYVVKLELKAELDKLGKKLYKAQKATTGASTGAIKESALAAAQAAIENGQDLAVLEVNAGLNSKAIKKAVEGILKELPVALLVVSYDEGKGKLLAYVGVHESLISGNFSAKNWLSEVLAVVGGKGGGKPGQAQGQAKGDREAVAQVLDIALSKAEELRN